MNPRDEDVSENSVHVVRYVLSADRSEGCAYRQEGARRPGPKPQDATNQPT